MTWFHDYVWLVLGAALLATALWGLASGRILSKYGSFARREEPLGYWLLVVGRGVLGVILVGIQIWVWNR